MQIPEGAAVKGYEDAEPGSLLVGRLNGDDPNFIAIRARSDKDEGPFMVILNPSVVDAPLPITTQPYGGAKVLDLGTSWSVDVEISLSAPTFYRDNDNAILVRSGPGLFILMRKEHVALDLATGSLVTQLPDNNLTVYWSAFTIYLHQPGVPAPGAEICRWPEPE
ncbi:MAG: hypothetical protein IH905_17580 [Proteobacteria bacterium]|nr:hypothetical protein [Pseudomonadota bacterium]